MKNENKTKSIIKDANNCQVFQKIVSLKNKQQEDIKNGDESSKNTSLLNIKMSSAVENEEKNSESSAKVSTTKKKKKTLIRVESC